MNHGLSQRICTLTVLSLKQNRGTYWNRAAYWDEGAYAVGALINKNTFEARRLLERGTYWNEGAKSNHYGTCSKILAEFILKVVFLPLLDRQP